MKFLFSIILTLFITSINAQVPGYRGKVWAVYGEVALSPALNYKYLDYTGSDQSEVPKIGLNCRFELATDITLSKSQALGVSVKHIGTHIPYAYYTTAVPENDFDYVQASYLGDVSLSANFVSFYIKLFPFNRKGSIAPVGHYTKLELAVGKASAKSGKFIATEDPFYSPDYINEKTLLLKDFKDLNYQQDGLLLAFIYSFGHQLVVFENGIVDLNTQFGWIMQGSPWDGSLYHDHGATNIGDFETEVNQRLNGTFFLNITFGMGYLLL